MEYTEALIETSPVRVRRRVAWGECDPAGIVYTPRFADYAMAGRDWFMRIGLGVLDRPHPARISTNYPMRAMSFDFMSPLAADDFFDMTVTVANISNRTFTVKIAATRVENGAATKIPAFTAVLTCVAMDSTTGQAIALPETTRTALEEYLASQSSTAG